MSLRWDAFWNRQPIPIRVEPTPIIPAACPGCGHLDVVLIRPIYRHNITAAGVQKVEVGSHVRCARCVREFMIGLNGVYEPKPEKPPTAADQVTERERAELARMRGYGDIPWNRG